VLELILDVALALTALGATLVCGMPLVFRFCEKGMWLSKMVLSFVVGYVLLSLLGVVAILLGLDSFIFIFQTGMILAGVVLSVHYRGRILDRGGLDREDRLVLGMAALYLLIGLFYFDRIIMWMGGDAVAHASIIRMLLEGEKVPISVYPFGSYWEYYPKAFHLYSFYWARAFPILNVIQTIPVLLSAMTPVLLYSLAREMGKRNEAVYAFVLACFVFSAHYSYLIWAGYPTLAAEMLLVASLLAVLVDWRLLALLLPGVLFTHTREMVLAAGALLAWAAATRLGRFIPIILAGGVALTAALLLLSPIPHPPEFLLSVATSQKLASEYAARWYPAFLSLFGAIIALQRRDRMDRLALAWAAATIVIVFLADCGPLGFVGTADRLMLVFYLPLSLLAATALSRMDGGDGRVSASFVLVLFVVGVAGMGAVFSSYAGSWGLPQEDYDAIMWLSGENLPDVAVINLDETGAWIYPIMGIKVSIPRVGPGRYYHIAQGVLRDPNDEKVLDQMRHLSHEEVIIYVSSVSISRPGHVPPFAEYNSEYPKINLSFLQENYDLLYDRGAKIFRVKRG
jgi:hypothetical protein